MRPNHAIAALALLVLLGAGLLTLWSSEPGSEALVAEGEAPAHRAEPRGPAVGELPEVPSRRESASLAAGPDEEPEVARADAVGRRAPEGWLLWLEVRAPADEPAVRVTVRARPDGEPFAGQEQVLATCALNERTPIELDELLLARRPLAALLIEAQHPTLHAETLNVALPSVGAHGSARPAPVDATLVLEAGARVVGDTRRPDYSPLKSRIGLWRFEAGGPQGEILLEAETDASGHFDLELPAAGEYLLVAAHAEYQPAWTRFDLPGVGVHDAGELVLETGAALQGRFTIGGRIPSHAVSFTLQREVEGVHLYWGWMSMASSPGSLVWTGARIERQSADQVADGEGGFHVQGLVPGDYALHLHGFDEGHGRMNRDPRPVFAPASGLNIELGWSRVAVRLELEDPTAPPEAAVLVLERPGRSPERSDCFGGELTGHTEREFVFDAGEPLAFQLEVEGLEPIRRELLAPPAGSRVELRFPVASLDRSAALRLELRGDLPAEGTPFVVHVVPDEGGPVSEDLGLAGDRGSHRVQLAEGALVLAGLSPGPARVLAYAGRWPGQRGMYLLDARTEVNLIGGQQTSAILLLERGGRLRVGKRDGDGGWSGSQCEILDAGRRRIDTTFVAYAPDGGGGTSARGELPDLAPSEVVPNLPLGTYVVRVGLEERTALVRPGETTEVLFD